MVSVNAVRVVCVVCIVCAACVLVYMVCVAPVLCMLHSYSSQRGFTLAHVTSATTIRTRLRRLVLTDLQKKYSPQMDTGSLDGVTLETSMDVLPCVMHHRLWEVESPGSSAVTSVLSLVCFLVRALAYTIVLEFLASLLFQGD